MAVRIDKNGIGSLNDSNLGSWIYFIKSSTKRERIIPSSQSPCNNFQHQNSLHKPEKSHPIYPRIYSPSYARLISSRRQHHHHSTSIHHIVLYASHHLILCASYCFYASYGFCPLQKCIFPYAWTLGSRIASRHCAKKTSISVFSQPSIGKWMAPTTGKNSSQAVR